MAAAARALQAGPKEQAASNGEITLAERHTDELVIALVGPVGSGVTKTAQVLETALRERFGYETAYIRLSKLIEDFSSVVGEEIPGTLSRHERIARLQAVGTKFRARFGEAYLAEKCVEKIATDRVARDGYETVGEKLVIRPRRFVHILDSLKNPAEVQLLREVYADTFWLFGIFAPEDIRKERLLNLGISDIDFQEIVSIDEEEGVTHGQRVRDTIHQADFFIRNDGENDERLRQVIDRYLSILFNIGVNTPTQHENGMYKAMSAASSSACLSRQVGAAIYSVSGELIGVGANDVPRKGGGLYTEDSGANDHRCYKWGGKICHNDDRKQRLYATIAEQLKASGVIVKNIPAAPIETALRNTDIRNLIEYSRAVHAEQEAIVSVARATKAGIVGATMYSTTFPCHACASLIVGSGIDRVLYIEPYVKSLALVLHRDAISVRDRDRGTHVLFLQYEGVAPKNIIRLFNHGLPRKKEGKLLERDPRHASPVFPSPLDGFDSREQIVVHRLERVEKMASGGSPGGGRDGEQQGPEPTQLSLADSEPPRIA